MTEQESLLLKKVAELTEENNKILRHMQSAARRARVWSALKLLAIIIALAVGYYYLQPYIRQVSDLYNQVQELQRSTQELNPQNLLKDIKGLGR